MKREFLFPILIIILMLFCIMITSSVDFFDSDQGTSLESIYFPLPEGYSEGAISDSSSLNYTNGNSSIIISQDDNLNIENKVNNYKNYLENNYQDANIENYVVNNVSIYKIVNNNYTSIAHYWFVKDNKSYEIYTQDGNNDIETIINNFVSD